MRKLVSPQMLTAALLTLVAGAGLAQAPPTVYSYTSTNNMIGPSTVTVQRDGSREVVQLTAPDPKNMNIRNFYDFTTHRIYTLDLNSGLCSTVAYTSPNAPGMNDVVYFGAELMGMLLKAKAKETRGATIEGLPTRKFEAIVPQGTFTVWIDTKYHIPLRYQSVGTDGKTTVLLEVSQLKFTAPPASTFIFPKNCEQLGGTTDANGGHVEQK